MITEDYCSFEVAKLLKEKGFDIVCNTAYYNSSLIDYTMYGFCLDGEFIFAPTHQMAMKWLREEKYISIVIDDEIPLSYKYIIKKYSINKDYRICVYKEESLPFVKYEYTVDAAIKYCLENLI